MSHKFVSGVNMDSIYITGSVESIYIVTKNTSSDASLSVVQVFGVSQHYIVGMWPFLIDNDLFILTVMAESETPGAPKYLSYMDITKDGGKKLWAIGFAVGFAGVSQNKLFFGKTVNKTNSTSKSVAICFKSLKSAVGK